jgi:hypothetical protein
MTTSAETMTRGRVESLNPEGLVRDSAAIVER